MGILDRLRGDDGGDKGGASEDGDGTSGADHGLGGLTEAFRKERAGMQKIGKADEADHELTPAEARDAAMAGPLSRGAVDPTTLLTYDDVEAYTGDRIEESVVGFAPSFVSVAFRGEAGSYRLASIHGAEGGGRWKVTRTWAALVESYDDVTMVDELGDAAFRTGAFTLVRSGDVILFVEVGREDLDPDEAAAMGAVLLRGALTSLGPAAG